jgi:hypothetical protein
VRCSIGFSDASTNFAVRLNLFGGCRVCVGTWNAGGRAPPEDLDIAEWLGTGGDAEPADIYVLG